MHLCIVALFKACDAEKHVQAPPMMCRGAPLTVAPAYQELVDRGFYEGEEAGVPAPGDPEDYDVVIPLHTSAHKIAFKVSSLQTLIVITCLYDHMFISDHLQVSFGLCWILCSTVQT